MIAASGSVSSFTWFILPYEVRVDRAKPDILTLQRQRPFRLDGRFIRGVTYAATVGAENASSVSYALRSGLELNREEPAVSSAAVQD
jgi:hypothetical protein